MPRTAKHHKHNTSQHTPRKHTLAEKPTQISRLKHTSPDVNKLAHTKRTGVNVDVNVNARKKQDEIEKWAAVAVEAERQAAAVAERQAVAAAAKAVDAADTKEKTRWVKDYEEEKRLEDSKAKNLIGTIKQIEEFETVEKKLAKPYFDEDEIKKEK